MRDSGKTRRDFIKGGAAAGVVATVLSPAELLARDRARRVGGVSQRPVVVASANGDQAVERAYQLMMDGADALDAVVAGVNIVEDDPNDTSVGYGGLPNADGIVELDSSVMHGPTGRAGAVASLQGIKNPSRVARLVLERTDHVLLVGKGAQRFAVMHGFKVENLLTDRAREEWVQWKESLSNRDDYLPPHSVDDRDIGSTSNVIERDWGTINCNAVDQQGNLSGVTTTSGLAFKIPGRVGDSPIIGAGLYVDNEYGAAGSTGRGEANLESLCSFLIVERIRLGDSPEQACLHVCERIAEHTKLARLQDDQGRPNFNVRFYAVNKAGEIGGAEVRDTGGEMSACDANGVRRVRLAYLFPRSSN